MVAIGLCTDSQYEYGVTKLVDCMSRVLENLDDNSLFYGHIKLLTNLKRGKICTSE